MSNTPDTQNTLTTGTTRAAPGDLPEDADLSRGAAVNFVSGSVDPRTGCYNLQVPILDIIANQGLGPHLSIGIQYNPYTVPDKERPHQGQLPYFGCTYTGISALEFYTREGNVATKFRGTLSTGVFVDLYIPNEDIDATLVTHTVKNVVIQQETNGGKDYLILRFESGKIEKLEGFQYERNEVAFLPVEIRDPSGHFVTLEWNGEEGGYPQLDSIKDENGLDLLHKIENNFYVAVPDYRVLESSKGSSDVIKISTTTKQILKDVNPNVAMDVTVLDKITRVHAVATISPLYSYQIGYQAIQVERFAGHSYGSLLFINSISTNTGLSEIIEYQNDAFKYPSQHYGLQYWRNHPLPGVSKHIIRPSFDSQPIYKKYQYTLENSYLGGGFVETDNPFYHFISDNYLLEQNFSTTGSNPTYGSIELFVDAQETHVYKQIRRIYNMYHLLVSEETSFDLPMSDYHSYPSAFHRVNYEYPLIENKPLEEQPLNYQFPTKISRYWQDKNANGQEVSREESTTYTYNERGHTIREVHPNGATVDRSFVYVNPWERTTPSSDLKKIVVLLAQEESGYRIKSEDPYQDVYPIRNVYYYQSSPSLMSNTNFYYLEKVESYNLSSEINRTPTLIQTKQNIYNVDISSVANYGRLKESIETLEKFRQIKTSYSFEAIASGRLLRKTTQTNLFVWNESSQSFVESTLAYRKTTASTLQYMLTGQIVSETSELGLVSKYQYGLSGRLVKKTECVGTSYEASKEFSYEIAGPTGNVIIQKDGLGVISKSYVDGLGRVIRLSKVIGGSEFVSETFVHDEIGRLKETRSFDNAQGQAIESLTQYRHDKWGQLTKTTSYKMEKTDSTPTELHNITIADPIALTVLSYQEGANKLQSGQTKTYLDINRQVIKTELIGEADSTVENFYDVAGKLRRKLDQFKLETRYTYDVMGRVTAVRLPYDDMLTFEHTIHYNYLVSNRPSPVQSIQITTKDSKTFTMGLREYNDALQLIKETVGGRVKEFRYADMISPPSEVVQPDGTVIYMKYIPELGHALAETYTSRNQMSKRNFSYDRWGRLIWDSYYTPEQEMHKNSYDYDSEGRLVTKRSEFTNHHNSTMNTSFTQSYTYSKMGRVLSENNSEGGNQSYTYDRLGHISKVTTRTSTGMIEHCVYYSALGDVSKYYSCKSNAEGTINTVFMNLYYDKFGRETCRSTFFKYVRKNVVPKQSQHVTSTTYDEKGRKAIESIWVYSNQAEQDPTQLPLSDARSVYYNYDQRNRLLERTSTYPKLTSDALPIDHTGNSVLSEMFVYYSAPEHDALNNLGWVQTKYLIQGKSVYRHTAYSYDNPNDRTQLTKVTIEGNDGYRKEFGLEYNVNGCLTKDEAGRQLSYNGFGELAYINGGEQRYWYDAHGQMTAQSPNPNVIKHFYSDINGMRSLEVAFVRDAYGKLTKQTPTYFHNAFGLTFAIQKDSDFRLLGANGRSSTLAEFTDELKTYSYTSYGANKTPRDIPGFNGEFADETTGVTHLGKGYRAYNPVLMRFHCPDSWSPFGAGGLNPYVYCAGDPINFTDPSGHSHTPPYSGLAYILAGLGILGGLALVVASGGGALAIGVGLTLGLASGALTIASMTVAGYDDGLSNRLGIAADVIGLIDMAQGIGTSIFAAVGAGRSVAGAAERITYGKNIHYSSIMEDLDNFYVRQNQIRAFIDTGVVGIDDAGKSIKGRRLNIMVHGAEFPENARSEASYTWTEVKDYYNRFAPRELEHIEGIRLMSCHAGENGVAKHLARIANKPVKSFLGTVTGVSFKSSEFWDIVDGTVNTPLLTKTGVNYNPVLFDANGRQIANYISSAATTGTHL